MICPRCGAQVRDGAPFCPKCGATMQGVPNTGMPTTPLTPNTGMPNMQGGNPNGNKKSNLPVILAIAISGAVIFLVTFTIMFMAFAEVGPFEPEPTPTPTPVPTTAPTPIPQSTVQVVYVTQPPQAPPPQQAQNVPITSGAVANPSYSRYSSSEYGFSCSYPTHFSVYDDGGLVTLYTVQAPDGSAREIIAATPIGGASVSSSLNSYISDHPGSISYKTSGADYYAVNIKNGATEYYKYCKFKNGNMYWFEFISPTAEHEIYDVYINDIYQSMSIY